MIKKYVPKTFGHHGFPFFFSSPFVAAVSRPVLYLASPCARNCSIVNFTLRRMPSSKPTIGR